jgi:hypothetical protein
LGRHASDSVSGRFSLDEDGINNVSAQSRGRAVRSFHESMGFSAVVGLVPSIPSSLVSSY